MATYRVGGYRFRYKRYRFGRSRLPAGPAAAAAAALVLAGTASTVHAHAADARTSHAAAHSVRSVSRDARAAIAFARAQIGRPYIWGGTGPVGFDCSGLVMMAWRSAGVFIPRTSQEQWAGLRHIPASQVRPGDLVFFAGADGTWTAPGHVAMVTGPHEIIQAYETGMPVLQSTFGLSTSLGGVQAGQVIGYARP